MLHRSSAERGYDATLWQNLVTTSNLESASPRSSTWRAAGRWAGGAALATARLLARLERRGYAVPHDRAVPGSRECLLL